MVSLSYIFTKFAVKILDFDNTCLPEQQFAIIQDMVANQTIPITGKGVKDILLCIKKKHIVNSITVRRMKDGVVFSSTGNGMGESKNASDLLAFVGKSFSGTDVITMRNEKEWVMLLPLQEHLYIVKANSTVSTVELKAIAKEIQSVLKKRHLS